jgi:uncharacterized protein (TIGR02722 family)
MRMQTSVHLVVVAGLALVGGGCASTGIVTAPLDRDRRVTERLSPDDARRTVEFMVDSMLSFGPLIELTATSRPVLDVDQIQNRTMEHIDTVSLTDSIRTRLIRSGKFRFKDRATSDTDIKILNEENELGLVKSDKAVKAGSQIATELYLYGAITQMRTEAGRLVDQYYKITLNLKSLKQGEIIWTDEKEIRNERKRPLI